jgi:hypothetical protein
VAAMTAMATATAAVFVMETAMAKMMNSMIYINY